MPINPLDRPQFNFVIDDFAGGLNSYFPPNKVGINFLTKAQNVLVEEDGVSRRRPGITRVTGAAMPVAPGTDILDMDVYGRADKRRIHVFIRDGGNIGLQTNDGATWITAASSFLRNSIGSLSTSTWVRESDGTEYVYFANDAEDEPVIRWTLELGLINPIGIELPDNNANPPLGAGIILNHVDRLWATAINGDDREKNFFSAAAINLELWDRLKFWIGMNTKTGQTIKSFAPYKEDMVFVGLECSCFLIAAGQASSILDWQVITVSNDIGVGSHKSVANVGEDIFFMDQFGDIRSLTRLLQDRGASVRNVPISLPIKDITRSINVQDIPLSWGVFFDSKYWITLTTPTDRKLMAFDVSTQRWFGPMLLKDTGGFTLQIEAMAVSCANLINEPNPQLSPHLYLLGNNQQGLSTDYNVFEFDEAEEVDDNNTIIEFDMVTKSEDFGFPHQDKVLDVLEVTYRPKSGVQCQFDIFGKRDFNEKWTLLGSVDYTGTKEVAIDDFNLKVLGLGRNFQFRITDDTPTAVPEIIRLVIRGRGIDPQRGAG